MRVFGALLLLVATAGADYEETEHRLKAAGVDAALRKRIHTAIDRAVAHLVSKQRANGSWAPQRPANMRTWHPPEAETVYASLALRHAGTPHARAAVRRGLKWLVPPDSLGRKNLHRHLYIAGPMLMLLQIERSHRDVALAITEAIEESQRKKSGWWGYLTFKKFGVETEFQAKDAANLSTTQFAALGLWADDRMRGRSHVGVWSKHLESLVARQQSDGSWAYAPFGPGRSYPCGTFMGTANLLLAMQGSGRALQLQPDLAARANAAKRRAIEALQRDGAAYVRRFAGAGDADGRVAGAARSYYTLYALEKACLFADLETLGDVRWYVEGAEALCATQRENGSWKPAMPNEVRSGSTIDTCFALLFLLRASQAYHPTTPRDVDFEKTPVSGGTKKVEDEKPVEEKPELRDSPRRTSVADAFATLDALRKRLGSKSPKGLPKSAEILALRGLWEEVQGTADDVERWREAATEFALTLAVHPPRKHESFTAPWDALQIAALQFLNVTRRLRADDLWFRVERGPLKARKWEPSDAYWHTLIFGLFPVLGGDQSAHRLLDTFLDLRESRTSQAISVLRGLREYRGLKPRTRYELTREIITRFEGMESKAGALRFNSSESRRWRVVGADVLATLAHFTRDGKTGMAARTRKGKPLTTVAQYRIWIGRRWNVKQPPWVSD
ncbi:MAG: hypothetical protein AAGD14_13300 [Planctomycetota bacterium]